MEWFLEKILKEEEKQTELLREILKELKPRKPGVAVSVRPQFEKEK